MFTHYRSRAFILKKTDQGEADRIFAVFTEKFGKIEILARSIRKIKSKLRSGAELFYLSEIEFIQGKNYKTLTDAILIDSFVKLRKNLIALSLAYKTSEAFGKLVKGQEPDENLWRLLLETFKRLDNDQLTAGRQQLNYYYFLWNLFSLLGYQLDFYHCLACQKKLAQENIFLSLKEKGLICSQCQKKTKLKKFILSLEAIKIIRIFLKKDWPTLEKLKIKEQDLNFLKTTSDYYFSEVLRSSQ